MKTCCSPLLLFFGLFQPLQAFWVSPSITSTSSSSLPMVGGKGWENNGFLDSLGGDQDDQQKAAQEYQEFSKSRQAFLKRNEERMKTPEGQRFMKQQQQQRQRDIPFGGNPEEDIDLDFEGVGGSSGGSRFRHLMQKSKQLQQRMGQPQTSFIDPATGLEQKFALPLDDDEEEEGENK